ncbi:uncharacterized protein LOC133742880 isoform X2 [Rosa rugosa]|uniref:uncharacterized protein LOC133742880 isoform X2 n=1 Tax=Rosa rugosa TaxID=74645 RepID=UPI002B403A9B|nr:uncharacterized protein LOC133742880 isoform X2 [Rosa rugosa]
MNLQLKFRLYFPTIIVGQWQATEHRKCNERSVPWKGEKPMSFALFATAQQAIAAKDTLQSMVFDMESKTLLHIEMAKKNLFLKRGRYIVPKMKMLAHYAKEEDDVEVQYSRDPKTPS